MKNKYSHKAQATNVGVVKVKTEGKGLGALKTLMVATLILLQVLLLIYVYVSFAMAFKWYLTASFVASLITCIYVLSSKKNGLSKAVWIIFLLLGFMFAHVIYLLSDDRFFFYRARKRYHKIFKKSEKYFINNDIDQSVSKAVENDCNFFKNCGKFSVCKNTLLNYFPSGAQLFDDVIERLKSAEKFIFIEYYIISDGVLLKRISDILKEKASNGVDVRIIYDDMGSHGTLTKKTKKELLESKIKMQAFNRLVPLFSVALNYRDHRKMIIIDGKTAYTGGCNLADEYINEKRLYGYWKDNGLRLDGQAVDSFSLIFLRQWEFLSKKEEDYSIFFNHYATYKKDSVVVPYADGLEYSLHIGKQVYENIISNAREKLYIMTPYFIPDEILTGILINKAISGVDVRIILPAVPDKKVVYGVSLNNAEKLSELGVKVYLMKNAFVHSKVVMSENSVVVGSINIDLRSFYQQFECAVYSNDKTLMEQVEKDFIQTIEDSEKITYDNRRRNNVIYRLAAGALQIFAPLM